MPTLIPVWRKAFIVADAMPARSAGAVPMTTRRWRARKSCTQSQQAKQGADDPVRRVRAETAMADMASRSVHSRLSSDAHRDAALSRPNSTEIQPVMRTGASCAIRFHRRPALDLLQENGKEKQAAVIREADEGSKVGYREGGCGTVPAAAKDARCAFPPAQTGAGDQRQQQGRQRDGACKAMLAASIRPYVRAQADHARTWPSGSSAACSGCLRSGMPHRPVPVRSGPAED